MLSAINFYAILSFMLIGCFLMITFFVLYFHVEVNTIKVQIGDSILVGEMEEKWNSIKQKKKQSMKV